MARLFDDAQNEYLQIEQAVVSAAPFTLACWSKTDNDAAAQCLMQIADKDVADNYWGIFFMGNAVGDPVRFIVLDGVGVDDNCQGGTYTANTWHHVCGVEYSNVSRAIFLDGLQKETDVVDLTPDNVDRTTIGRTGDSTPAGYLSGEVAWPAVWNVALSDDEIASLAAGTHPTRIRPDNLVSFPPLGGLDTMETDGGTARDIWGGFDLTANSDAVGPGIADHPGGLSYPGLSQVVIPTAAAPGGLSIPIAMRHYLQMQGAG